MKTLFLALTILTTISCQKDIPSHDIHIFLKKLNILLLKKNIIQQNILNVSTTRTEKGGPYIPVEAMNCKEYGCDITPLKMRGIGANPSMKRTPIMKYEPNHPDANKNGYVAYPNINLNEERVKVKRVNTAISFLMKTMPVTEGFFFLSRAQDFLSKYPEVDREFNFKKLLME